MRFQITFYMQILVGLFYLKEPGGSNGPVGEEPKVPWLSFLT